MLGARWLISVTFLHFSPLCLSSQYLPNIANEILTNSKYASIPLTGLAVGNGCWGGDKNSVNCNGPNSDQNDLDNYWGKGLISNAQYFDTYQKCNFQHGGATNASAPTKKTSNDCQTALEDADNTVGPHDVYDIYDNCPGAANEIATWHEKSGKSVRWLKNYMRQHLSSPSMTVEEKRRHLTDLAGGYQWVRGGGGWRCGCDCGVVVFFMSHLFHIFFLSAGFPPQPCGGLDTLADWLSRDDIRKALHFDTVNPVHFNYDTSGPASITLWPFLATKLRVLIYNGDADDCVPYHGNEEWTTYLASNGQLTEETSWHPWYLNEKKKTIPQGYATTYTVPGSTKDFSFITIRLAGHMVPAFRNDAAFAFFSRFLAGEKF